MFYLVKNLKTEVVFSPYDMDKLSRSTEVISRVRDKIEGRCHSEYGYIIQIANVANYGKDGSQHYLISTPEVREEGCVLYVTFSAICFKGSQCLTQPKRKISWISSC